MSTWMLLFSLSITQSYPIATPNLLSLVCPITVDDISSSSLSDDDDERFEKNILPILLLLVEANVERTLVVDLAV